MKRDEVILIVEDDAIDALSVKQALADNHVPNPAVILATAQDALNYLLNRADDLPGLMLLDLNLPGMSGLEFLHHIKTDAKLKRIPVIILTSSNEEKERHTAFDLSAAGYFVKPMDYHVFVEVIKVITSYWLMAETAQ